MSTESDNKKYTLNDRENSLRHLARKYREIHDKDYPQPDEFTDNALTFNDELSNLKSAIRATNLQYDNIRPIFMTLEIPKK